jgi:hypothetical protein
MPRIRFVSAVALAFCVGSAFGQGLTTVSITDPVFNMKAFTVTIPAGWKVQSTVLPGPECSRIPMPVAKAYAPDGLQEMRLEPAFNWTFHPTNKAFHGVPGCLNLNGPISAAEFLKKYEEMIGGNGLHVIGPMAVGSAYQQRVSQIGNNWSHIGTNSRGSADAAAVRVETVNGTFVIEQRLRVYVACHISNGPIDPNGGACMAQVDVERAPKGKLDALCALVDAHDLAKAVHDDAYAQRVQQMLAARARQDQIKLTQQEQASSAMLRKQFEDFMATSKRNHEAFMAQQDASFHASMNSAIKNMNARSTNTSDWVDYALDRQTVTGSGGTVKVSSAYSQVWSNGQNEWFGTNDPNSNPNGVLPGNWTQNTKVHGNGQPY